jgi:hypothetical protein
MPSSCARRSTRRRGTREALEGHGEPLRTLEIEGQMIQRVMGELMGMKGVVVINDEAITATGSARSRRMAQMAQRSRS